MKRVARSAYSGAGADTSGDVEFTDWEEVEAFGDGVAAFVEKRTGEAVEARRGWRALG